MDVRIEEEVDQLRRLGWCVLERVIPEDKIDGVRAHVEEVHAKAKADYEELGGSIGPQTGPDGEPGVCLISYLPEFAPYLGDERLLAVAHDNPSPEPRVAIITRYCPWWLSVEFGGRNNAVVPREVYAAMPEAVKALYRHRAEGEDNPFRDDS